MLSYHFVAFLQFNFLFTGELTELRPLSIVDTYLFHQVLWALEARSLTFKIRYFMNFKSQRAFF